MSYESYLSHHGVLGMRWGVRRYRNYDGTLTNAGKRRAREDYRDDESSSSRRDTMKKVGIAVGVTAATAITAAYIYKHPEMAKKLVGAGSKFVDAHKDEVISSLKSTGKAAGGKLKGAASRAADAALDAALLAVGTIAISKLSAKFETKEGDSEHTKMRNEIVVKSGTAAINSLTKANHGGSNSNKKGGPVGKEEGARISAVVGPPKQKDIDRTGSAYQALFKDGAGNTRSQEQRAIIKSMASAGYGVDQIQQYLDTLGHSFWVYRGEPMTAYESYLAHHGVLGMRWGVRRYRNYDGTYTKKGLDHYKKFESDYNTAKSNYKSTKASYKSGNATKSDVKASKETMKEAKRKLSRSYDQLKRDYAGDKGKELYRRGKTITGNDAKMKVAGTILSGAMVARKVLRENGRYKEAQYATYAALGMDAIIGVMSVKTMIDNKNLRAYYGHSRPKDL